MYSIFAKYVSFYHLIVKKRLICTNSVIFGIISIGDKMKIKIVATTDIHGSIFPTNYTTRDQKQDYSLAHISSAIKKFRSEGTVLLLDNGDAFQGTPLLTYAHQNIDTVLNPIAQVFNTLKYDYINLGNHDFNYGLDVLKKFIKENNAPLLTSNVFFDGNPVGKTQILEYGGKRIALIGVLTQFIPHWERPSHLEGVTLNDAYEHMKAEVEAVKDSVDYVIGMYHGGFEKDLETGEPTERQTGENEGYQMSFIDGLDILITGHQHRSIATYLHGKAVTQTTLKAKEFATIDFDLDTGEIIPMIHQTEDYSLDEEILKPLATLQENVQNWLDQPIGSFSESSPSLIIEDEFEARIRKHPLVSFMNQVQKDRSGAQLSSVALFNGSIGFNKSITMRELVGTYIYPNTLVVKRITGSRLKKMLEYSAYFFTIDENNQIAVSPDYVSPKPQHYNYDMVDGVSYTIHVANPRGSRIADLKYQGRDVEDDDTFTIVVNNYRAAGGGGYMMVAKSDLVEDIQEEMVDTLMNYFQENSPVEVEHEDNILVTY